MATEQGEQSRPWFVVDRLEHGAERIRALERVDERQPEVEGPARDLGVEFDIHAPRGRDVPGVRVE